MNVKNCIIDVATIFQKKKVEKKKKKKGVLHLSKTPYFLPQYII